MTCSPLTIDGNPVILCHRGPRVQQCAVDGCEEFATHACDWKTGSGTCDAPMCEAHRTNVSQGKDLCTMHAEAWREHPANPQRELTL